MRNGWKLIVEKYPEAYILWEVAGPNDSTLKGIRMPGRVVVLHEYANGDGWEVYAPLTESNRIDQTLEALGREV